MTGRRLRALAGLLAAAVAAAAEQTRDLRVTFASERFEAPQLALLRKLYDFDETVCRGGSEVEQMLLLADWVFRRVPYRQNFDLASLRDSLQILELAASGVGVLCTQLSAVYVQLAAAMGWTARYLCNRTPAGDEHTTNEIWSNQLGKWIYIDPTWNLHVEKSGVPLSALEARREWLANKGRDLVYVFGAGANEARYTRAQFPVRRADSRAWQLWPLGDRWLSYTFEMAWIWRNDFFANNARFWDDIRIYRDEANRGDEGWGFRDRPAAEVEMLYHDVNRVDIGMSSHDARLVTLTFRSDGPRNIAPGFDCFLVRVGGGAWKPLEGDTLAVGMTGPNATVQARLRNKAGVLGPVTTRVVRSQAQPLAAGRR